jgi:hypothetical protein
MKRFSEALMEVEKWEKMIQNERNQKDIFF